MEQFNIRTLTVVLGTFNTGFLGTSTLGKTPLADDYKGTMAEKVLQLVSTGNLKPNGDRDKAMKALYEVIAGEGVGKGHEQERLLLLGSDMTPRAKGVQEALGHALDVFGTVTNGVGLD